MTTVGPSNNILFLCLLACHQPGKSTYTAIREFVENSLDAAEDGRILPDVIVMVDCIDKKIARPPLYGSPGKPKYLPWLRHHFDDHIDDVIWIRPPLARFCQPHHPSLPPPSRPLPPIPSRL